MTLTEFLLARIAEDEAERVIAAGDPGWHFTRSAAELAESDRWKAECEAKRRIVELHESWPVLVRTMPSLDRDPGESLTFRMSQQIAWHTEREYRERFGDEPPTAPILAALASVYADHPDYREEWKP